jgi:hypothetical protein
MGEAHGKMKREKRKTISGLKGWHITAMGEAHGKMKNEE